MSRFDEDPPEHTSSKRETLFSESTDNGGVIDREDNRFPLDKPNSLLGATFKGKKTFLNRDFISSDRISNRNLNALGIVGYLIQVEFEGRRWKIFKRRKEFGNLHDKLALEMRRKEK
jgi:hypothetical protein